MFLVNIWGLSASTTVSSGRAGSQILLPYHPEGQWRQRNGIQANPFSERRHFHLPCIPTIPLCCQGPTSSDQGNIRITLSDRIRAVFMQSGTKREDKSWASQHKETFGERVGRFFHHGAGIGRARFEQQQSKPTHCPYKIRGDKRGCANWQ